MSDIGLEVSSIGHSSHTSIGSRSSGNDHFVRGRASVVLVQWFADVYHVSEVFEANESISINVCRLRNIISYHK